MAGGIGNAEGKITVDTGQAVSSINDLAGSISKLDATAGSGKGIGNFNQSTVGMAQGMQNVGRATAALGVGIAAPFIAATGAAIDFESQMAGVNAVMDLQGDQFQNLNDKALQLGKDTNFSATEAAQGIEALGKAGVQYEDIMGGAADASTNLAAAAGTSVPAASEIIAAALNAYSLEGSEATEVADMLAGASNSSLASVEDLGTGFAQVAGVASALGVPMDELITQLAIMTDMGLSGSDAATSLKTAMNSLVAPIGQAAEEQGNLGISFRDSNGEFIGIKDTAELLVDTYDALGYSQADILGSVKALAGQDGYRALLFAMQEVEDERAGGTKGWDEYSRAVNENGAAQKLAEERMDSTAGSIEKLKGSIETLSIIAGGTLADAIRGPIDAATELVNAFSNIPAPILGAAAAIGTAIGSVAAVGGTIAVVAGYVLEGVARMAAAGVTFDVIAAGALRVAAAVSGIIAVVALLKFAWDNNIGGIADSTTEFLNNIQEVIQAIHDMKDAFGADGSSYKSSRGGLAADIEELAEAIRVVTGVDVTGAANKIADFVQAMEKAGRVVAIWTRAWNNADDSNKSINDMARVVKTLGMVIDTVFGTNISDTTDKIADFIDEFVNFRDAALAAGASGVGSALIGLAGAVQELFGVGQASSTLLTMASAVETLVNTFNASIDAGFNPAAAALNAIGVAARGVFGLQGLGEWFIDMAGKAQAFGSIMDNLFNQSQIDGANGLSGVLAGLREAMEAVFGLDISGLINPAIQAIEAFTKGTATAAAEGAGPLGQAIAGLDALFDAFLTPEQQQFLDGISQGIQDVSLSVQNLLGAGLDRVGQLFGEIGTAISAGDFGGVAIAFGSLVSDIQAELSKVGDQLKTINIQEVGINILGFAIETAQDIGSAIKNFFGFGGADPNGGGSFRGGTGGTAIAVPSIAVNILDFIVSSAKNIGDSIKTFFGFGEAGPQGGRPGGSAGATGTGAVIDVPSIAVNILDFVVSSAKDIGTAIKEFFGFGSGDANGGGSFRGGTGAPVDIPAITVKIADFIVESAANIGDKIKEFVATGGGGNPNGGGSFRGGGGAAVELDQVGISIKEFVAENLPSVGALATKISTHIKDNLAGLVKTTIEDIAIALGIPDVTWDDFGAVVSQINEPLKQIAVSGEFVAEAERVGAEIGTKLGTALGEGISGAIGGGGGAGGRDTMFNANQVPKYNFQDAMAAFTDALVESFKASAGPAIDKAGDEIQQYLKDKIGEMVRGIFSVDLLPADVAGTSPAGSGNNLGGNIASALGLGENGLIGAIKNYFEGQAPDVENAAKEGAKTGIAEPAEVGVNDTLGSLTTDLANSAGATIDGITGSGLWEVLFPKQGGSIVNGTDAAERIMGPDFGADYQGAIGDSMIDAVDGLDTGGIATAAGAASERIGIAAGQEAGKKFGEGLVNKFETDAGSQNGNMEAAGVQAIETAAAAADAGAQYGVPADTFVGGAKTLVDKAGDALQGAVTGLQALAGGGGVMEAAGTGLMTDVDGQISTGVDGATLPATETAIGGKVSEATGAGISKIGAQGADAARGGAAAAGSSIGSALDQVLATSIGGTTLEGFSQQIGVKIGEAITTGLAGAQGAQGGRPGGAAGAADTSIGSSIANSLATSLAGADFAAVGTAIQGKISEALTAGLAAGEGAQAPAGGAGAGIGASIATSLASSIASADFTMVGSAISTKISAAVSTATAGGGAQGGRPGGAAGAAAGGGLGASIVASIVSDVNGADFGQIGQTIATRIGETLASTNTLNGAMTTMVSAAIQAGVAAASQATQIGNMIATHAGSGAASASALNGAVGTMVSAAIQAGVAATSAGTQIGSMLGTHAGSGAASDTAFSGGVTTMVSAAIAAGVSAASAATEIGMMVATHAGSGAASATELNGAVTTMVSAAIDAGVGAAAGASVIGAAISSGAASGVILTAMNDAVATMVSNGIAAGMAAADASSPSKKMIELGGWMSEGAAIGVEKESKGFIDNIRNMAQKGITEFGEIAKSADAMKGLGQEIGNIDGLSEFGQKVMDIAGTISDQSGEAEKATGSLIDKIRKKLKAGQKGVQKDSKALSGASASASAGASSSGAGMSMSVDTKGFKSSVRDVLKTLNSFEGGINELKNIGLGLQQVSGLESYGDQLLAVADTIDQSKAEATTATEGLMNDVTKVIKQLKKQIKAASKDAGKDVGAGISEGMAESTPAVESATTETSNAAVTSLNANLSRLPEMAEAMGAATGEGLTEGVQGSLPAAEQAGSDLAGALDTGIESMDNELGNAGADASNMATDTMTKQATANLPVIEQSGAQLGDALNIGLEAAKSPEAALAAIKGLHDSITSAVQGAIPSVTQDGKALGDAVGTGIAQSNPTQTGKSLVDEATTGITSGAAQGSGVANKAGTDIGSSLQSGIDSACAPINKSAADLTDSCVPQGIESGAGTATDTAMEAGQDISGGLMKGLDIKKKDVSKTFDAAGSSFGDAMKQGIGSKQQSVVSQTNQTVDAAGKVSGTSRAVPVGTSIVDGMVQGIKNGTSKITAAVDQAVQAGIDAAKAKSESKSPSKVFMRIGEDFMLGAAIGVDNKADLLAQATERATQGSIDLFNGTGMIAATRQMDRAMDGYAERVTEAIYDMNKAVEGASPRAWMNDAPVTWDISGSQEQRAVEDHDEAPIIQFGDIVLKQGDPGFDSARQLANQMRGMAGQYRPV